MIRRDDSEFFKMARRELFTAVIGDVMDKLGMRRQFLPQPIQPLQREMVVVGRALTVLEADFFEEVFEGSHSAISARSFGLMLEALDDLKVNEVYVSTGASPRFALWGELMTRRAMKCGAAGAVLDGYSRDTRGVLASGFPVFSRGSYAQDQGPRGKVLDYRIPIEMQGVRIESGDILFGDMDGVCVVPKAAEQEVFVRALEKARAERSVGRALDEGMTASDAFAKYGIL
ncbi:MAG TPA: RraA family protein [Bryobacteraceae bacterium]|jgi:regulator of RNase E activity RraA|nr:RraA family protein [Bryobacteraceae bacterium]